VNQIVGDGAEVQRLGLHGTNVTSREIPGKPFEEKWHISHLEYDEPQACLNVFQNDNHTTIFNPYSRSVWEVAATDSNKDVRLPIDRFPIWTKSLAAMLAGVNP
jgi:hypothetical protein